MDQAAIDRVLSCRTLPSLPGVALEVLELTRDARVPIEKIARVVQNDGALTTKILRTVNSSYYGLTNPCPTINRAVSLLGLNTVKSLVLGFSLVEMTGKGEKRGFDLVSYWRRTVYSAAGARLISRYTRVGDPEEAFIGGLLQDVGMLAMHAALGDAYSEVLNSAPDDHDQLAALEQQALGFDHAEVGSLLAEKWKLPPLIVECTKRHHRPETAAPAFLGILRQVSLGADAAATLSQVNPRQRLDQFGAHASEWFGVKKEESDQLLADIAEGAAQLSSLLEIKTGPASDTTQILADAHEQLTTHQLAVEQEADQLQRSNLELAKQVITDGLTGAANRKHFDAEIERLFTETSRGGPPVSVLFIDADRFKTVNDSHGHHAGDAVLIELCRRMRETIAGGGTVCRYGGEEFAVILPACLADKAVQVAESIRLAIQSRPFDIRSLALSTPELSITISLGVASTDGERFDSAAQLVHAADEAVYTAKKAGRNCVRVGARPQHAPSNNTGSLVETIPVAATAPGSVSVLLVENDPLAAKLIELIFAKRTDVSVVAVGSAEDALRMLHHANEHHERRIDLVMCALNLPGLPGLGLIRTLRIDPNWNAIPIIAMTSLHEAHTDEAARAAGATAYLAKSQICANLARATAQIIQLGTEGRRAAA